MKMRYGIAILTEKEQLEHGRYKRAESFLNEVRRGSREAGIKVTFAKATVERGRPFIHVYAENDISQTGLPTYYDDSEYDPSESPNGQTQPVYVKYFYLKKEDTPGTPFRVYKPV